MRRWFRWKLKRWQRWVANGFALVCLLMLLATILVWVGSYRNGYEIGGVQANVGNFYVIYYQGRYEYVDAGSHIEIHFWHDAIMCSVLAVFCFWLGRPGHTKESGCCPRCGYDLRATPDRCPECGAVAPHLDPLPEYRERRN